MDVLAAVDDDIVPSRREVQGPVELADIGHVVIGQSACGAGVGHLHRTRRGRPQGHDGADERITDRAATEAPQRAFPWIRSARYTTSWLLRHGCTGMPPAVSAIPVQPGDCCFIEKLLGCEAATGATFRQGAACAAAWLQRRPLTVLHATGKAGSDPHAIGLDILNLLRASHPVEANQAAYPGVPDSATTGLRPDPFDRRRSAGHRCDYQQRTG